MTVKELKEELDYYCEDAEVIFEVCDDFEPESVTEDKWGHREVRIDTKVKPYFISESHGDMLVELDRVKE